MYSPVIAQEDRSQGRLIGASVRRIEDMPYVTGTAHYVDDFTPPGCYYLSLVRSTYAHAKITSIDTSRLADVPGIVFVMTGEDLKKLCRPILNWSPSKSLKAVDTYPLAVGKVRYAGEPVVAVVCTSRMAASDASDAVTVEYETLPVVVDAEKGIAPDAPLLYEELGDNILLRHSFKSGDVEGAFKSADLVVRERISCHRHSPVPLEGNCYLATYDAGSGLTVWATTQHPHVLRTILAETLAIPETAIRVVQPDVGGGFGGKSPVHAEEILVSLLAYHLKSAIKYTEDRSEHLRASHQAREQVHYIELAANRDGTILAARDKIIANLGVYYPVTGANSVINASRFITGCYRIQNYETEVIGVTTNKAPYGAYRGFGKDAASYVIERCMDILARKLNLDPLEIRMRNLIKKEEIPYRTATGAYLDSGDYELCLRKVAESIHYDALRKEQETLRAKGRYLGIGISLVLEPTSSHVPNSLFTGYDGTAVRVEPSGEVSVLTGVTSTGTGTKTVFAQIVADELGVPLATVSVVQGDSSQCPYGFGMWASRGIVVGGNSALLAARKLKDKVMQVAAAILDTDVGDLTLKLGVIESKRYPKIRLSMKDVASAFYRSTFPLPRDMIESGLEATVYYFPPNVESAPDKSGKRNAYATYGSSACAAVVEVDAESGVTKVKKYVVVADAGKVINPMIVEGQVHGGVVQGLGGTLYEENVYDENGQPLTTTLMDYLIPSAVESPEIELLHVETVSSATALGSKGVGEGPIEGVYGTIANAVEDALTPFGVQIRDLPLTPERVWKNVKVSQSS